MSAASILRNSSSAARVEVTQDEAVDEADETGEGPDDEHPIVVEPEHGTDGDLNDVYDQGEQESDARSHEVAEVVDAALQLVIFGGWVSKMGWVSCCCCIGRGRIAAGVDISNNWCQ